MNRYLAFFLLLVSMSIPMWAQNQAPALLHEAAHCLVTDKHNWLDSQTLNAPELSLGYHPDAKTSLGDKYLYVVVYTTPRRNQGKIFDIRFKQQDHRHLFNIENSATFVSSKNGVEFPEPPLGGTWAQAQLAPAIQQMEQHRKWYTASLKYLVKPSDHIQCESYADHK
jgi:hypothetical protein